MALKQIKALGQSRTACFKVDQRNRPQFLPDTASGNRDLQGIKIATPAGGEASIQQVTNSQWSIVNSQLYDLQGRKVIHPTRGIYILNGKKIVVK